MEFILHSLSRAVPRQLTWPRFSCWILWEMAVSSENWCIYYLLAAGELSSLCLYSNFTCSSDISKHEHECLIPTSKTPRTVCRSWKTKCSGFFDKTLSVWIRDQTQLPVFDTALFSWSLANLCKCLIAVSRHVPLSQGQSALGHILFLFHEFAGQFMKQKQNIA